MRHLPVLLLLLTGCDRTPHDARVCADTAPPPPSPRTAAPTANGSDFAAAPTANGSDFAAAPTANGSDFAAVFAAVSPSVVGVAAGVLRDGRFEPRRLGTGFAWDAEGRFVTNDHILGESTELRVRAYDGRVRKARLVGRDGPTDLALLAVKGLRLPAPPRGDARALRPGSWVAAIGNPYGMSHSITVGVVSAVGRRRLPPGGPRYADFIQTDASVNPGSSGGPLVDGEGKVIGLTTAMLEGNGLSFATPIDMVETVVADLIEHGRFIRGFAGLYVKDVSPRAATKAGLDQRRGARVSGVVADSPASKAGIRAGDIILSYQARPLQEAGLLPWLIAATRPGTSVKVRLARGPSRLDRVLVVGSAPD